jgi:uncharacterized repeat protein (TIGR03803 family)
MKNFNVIKFACMSVTLCATLAVSLHAQTLTTLFTFDGTNGENPNATFLQGFDGNLYGTAYNGGTNGYGTAFKMAPDGTLTLLYSFCAKNRCIDGAGPLSLVLAPSGNFYGTTASGGTNGGYGTFFEITPAGHYTVLHSFTEAEGSYPTVMLAANGNFYGTTNFYGANENSGTLFEITARGTVTILHNFCSETNCTDGANPSSLLVQASNGNLYGATAYGGAYNLEGGTIFEVTPAGKFSVVYSFCADNTCDFGLGGVGMVAASNGKIYGTTGQGGATASGSVFEMTLAGHLTTLYSFCSQANCSDGLVPWEATFLQATDGNLYGTTSNGGGSGGNGTIFKITTGGTLTTLYDFCSLANCSDGSIPRAGLTQATNGTFYGNTYYGGELTGGDFSDGVNYSFSVGLGPFVKTVTTSGELGSKVVILGNNLTGSTSVTFNGAAAAFTVVSDTEITATVPSGATSGTVQVTTPTGKLDSNTAYLVK